MFSRFNVAVCLFSLVLSLSSVALSQELIKPPEGFVRYKLSNLRVERSVLGQVVAIDYKRTQDGQGSQEVQLAARTDDGRLGIIGLASIDESGTIRLRDQFPGLSRILGQRERGMEFFIVVNSRGPVGYYHPSTARLLGGKEYLVSNVVRRGKMNSKVAARPLTNEEKEAYERGRKASSPPESLPSGFTRGKADSALAIGAPLKIGQGGEWKDAIVVALPTPVTVKAKTDSSNYLRTVSRKDWIAISEATARQIRENPNQFSTRIRSLPGGNLVLDEGVEPLQDAMALVKGTPLLRENSSTWQDVHFLSSDNMSVRVLVNQFNQFSIEIVPKSKLAIRRQTLADLQKENAKQAFSTNVEGYETKIAGLAKFPGDMDATAVTNPRVSTGALSGGVGPAEFPSSNAEATDGPAANDATPNPIRTWSDRTGKFKVEAQLVEKTEQSVTLRRPNGRAAEVPLAKLSDEDLSYLKKLDEQAENPFAALVEKESSSVAAGLRDSLSADEPPGSSGQSVWDYRVPLKVVSKVTGLGWGPKSVSISLDNKHVIVGRAGAEVSICDLESGRILMSSGRMDHLGNVTAARYTPDGKFLVIGGAKGTVEVYQVAAQGKMELKVQFAAHTKHVVSVSFSSDGRYALTGGADKEARFWEVATGRQIASVTGFAGKVKATCVRSDDSELLATDGKTLIVYDLGTKQVTRTIEVGRSEHNQGAAISPNGLLLAFDNGYNIVLWNLASFRQMPTIEGTNIPWVFAFGPDSRHLFTGHNGVVNIWDTKYQSRVISCTVGSSHNVQTLGVSSDGSTLACSSGLCRSNRFEGHPSRIASKTVDGRGELNRCDETQEFVLNCFLTLLHSDSSWSRPSGWRQPPDVLLPINRGI